MSSVTIHMHVGKSHPDMYGALSPDETTRDWPAFNLIIRSPEDASGREGIREQALNEIRAANLTSLKRLYISMEEEDWTDRFRAELDLCIPQSIICTEFRLVKQCSYEKAYVFFRGDPLVGQPTYSSLAVSLDSLFDKNGNRDMEIFATIFNMYNLHHLNFYPPRRSESSSVKFMDALVLILPFLDSSVIVSPPHHFLPNVEDQEEFNFHLRRRI